jgi:hypothetical protein
MSYHDEVTRLEAALDAAEREKRWSDVASLRAELDAARKGAATEAEEARRAAAIAESRRLERERVKIEDATQALENRWQAWLAAFDEADAQARQLWQEHASIRKAEAELGRACEKTGARSNYLGRLSEVTRRSRDGYGALRWQPKSD